MKIEWTKEFGYKRYTFTLAELRDLAISAAVLGFLFSTALGYFEFTTTTSIFSNFLIAIAIVGPALICHELAHKFVAQKYDCKAHYALWPLGTIIAIAVTLITGGRLIFAALGAVMISTSYSTRLGFRYVGLSNEELGKISWSGPMTNFAIAIAAFILSPLNPALFGVVIQINLIIALFNLIPFPPLDGSKIIGWSWLIWGGTLSSVIILWILPGIIGAWFSVFIAAAVVVAMFFLSKILAPWKHPQERR